MVNKKILVTGGLGFIGRHLVKKLQSQNYDVYIIDNLSNSSNNKKSDKTFIDDFGSIEKYASSLKDLDTVIHLAANTVHLEDKKRTLCDDILETVKLLDFCKGNGVRKFIFSSSAAVYGRNNLTSEYNEVFRPLSFYGISKLTIEKLLALYKLDTTVLRYFNVYGPQNNKGIIYNIIDSLKNDKPISLYYDNIFPTRDFIYVDDVVDITAKCIDTKVDVLNVGSGIDTSIGVVVKKLVNLFDKVPIINHLPSRKEDVLFSQADIERLRFYFNKSFIDIDAGLGLVFLCHP